MPTPPNRQDCAASLPWAESAAVLPAAGDEHRPTIEAADWDALFDAVATRLRHTVGEDLYKPPDVPVYTAALSASLIQAVVLDCVGALDKLHAALKHERSQRPTP